MTKMDFFRGVGARGGCFGVGLSVHHQARFKSFDFVVLAVGIFLIVLNVLLGHNNSQ